MGIRQRKWTWKGKEKSAWVVDYFDAKGKRRLKTFKTKREADNWRSETKVELRQGNHVAARDGVTVAEAGKLWIAACEADGLEPATIQRYRQLLDLHIVPRIGAKKLHELTVPSVRDFADDMRADGRSATLVSKVITHLGGLIADAQERGLTPRNPVRERKRKRRGAAAERHEGHLEVGVDIPTPAEIRAILHAATGFRRAFFATAALTGLRVSELRGVMWRDVDFTAATITVRQRADKFGTIGSPKAPASRRTVPVAPLVLNALREWKLACPRRDGELLLAFPDANGHVQHYRHIQRDHWHPLQVAAGVSVPVADVMLAKYSGLHALRHFYCSWCAARPQDGGLGLPLKMVQARMGHGTLAMTADRYGHLFPATDDAEVLAAGERALMGA